VFLARADREMRRPVLAVTLGGMGGRLDPTMASIPLDRAYSAHDLNLSTLVGIFDGETGAAAGTRKSAKWMA